MKVCVIQPQYSFDEKEIDWCFVEVLSWARLCYVREPPAKWDVPICILYGEHNETVSYEAISKFA